MIKTKLMKITPHQLIAELKKYITGDRGLILYAADDFANLEELVNEFVPNGCHDIDETCLEHPKKIIGRLLNIFIWGISRGDVPKHIEDSLIGYSYLIRSHIGFLENEAAGKK